MPKLRIEETAATRQAMIDRGDEVIVGVNKYRKDQRGPDRHSGRRQRQGPRKQIAGWSASAPPRQAACDAALDELTRRAARAAICWKRRSRPRAPCHGGRDQHGAGKGIRPPPRRGVRTLAGVYGAAYEGDEGFAAIQKSVEDFAEDEGRRPRMLVVKMGQDGHDRGAKVIATAFADIGFDVDVGPLFQTPEEAAQDAIDNDVHVVGIQPGGRAQDAGAAADRGAEGADAGDIIVICGGVIPQQDYEFLQEGRGQGDLRAGHQHSRGGAGHFAIDPRRAG